MSRPDSRPSAASAAPRESGPAAASATDPSARPTAASSGGASTSAAENAKPESAKAEGAKPEGGVTVRVTGGRAVRTDAGGRKFEAQPGRWTPSTAGGAASAAAAAGIAGAPQEDESKDDPEAFSAAARTAVPADTSTAGRRAAAAPPGPNGNLQARSPVVAANGREDEEDLIAPRTWETSLGVLVLGGLVLGLGGLVGYRYWPLATGKALADGPVAAVTGAPTPPPSAPGKETKSPTLLIPGRKDSLFPPRDPNVKTVHYERSEASERTPPTEAPRNVPGAIPSTLPTERIAGERIPSARDAEELAPEVPASPIADDAPKSGASNPAMRIRTNPTDPAGADSAPPKAGASFASFPNSPVAADGQEPAGASGSAFASPFPSASPSDRAAPPKGDAPPETTFMGVPGEMPLPTSRRAAPRSPRAGSAPREPGSSAAFPVGAVGAYPTARDGAAGEQPTAAQAGSTRSGDPVEMPSPPSGAFPREPLPSERAAPTAENAKPSAWPPANAASAKTSAWPPTTAESASPRTPAGAYASPWDTTAPSVPAAPTERAAPAAPQEPSDGAKPGTAWNGFGSEDAIPAAPQAPAESPFPGRPEEASAWPPAAAPTTERSPRETTAPPSDRAPTGAAQPGDSPTAPAVSTDPAPEVPPAPTERMPKVPSVSTDHELEVPTAPTERTPKVPTEPGSAAPSERMPATPAVSPWPSSPPERPEAAVGTPVEREPVPPSSPPPVAAPPAGLPGGFREAGTPGEPTPRSPEPGFRSPSAPAADEEEVPALPIRDGRYEVRPGDNYWTLAQRFYGDGGYHKALAAVQASDSGRGGLLRVGDMVTAPPLGELRGRFPQLCPKEPHSAGAAATVAPRTYRVRGGETLHDVARTQLGKPGRWIEIYDLNQDHLASGGAALPAGLELILPEDPTARPAAEMATPRVRFAPSR